MSNDEPWFRPELGDRHLSDEEWHAKFGDRPCTCARTGQAMCWPHTASRLSITIPSAVLDELEGGAR